MRMGKATERVRSLAHGHSHWRGRFIRNYATFGGLVVICIIFATLKPAVFLTATNLRNILAQVAILGIIALMQTLVLVVGDFDLSLGAQVSFTSVVVAQLMVLYGMGTAWAVLLCIVIGAAVGAINGLLVSYVNVSAFVATLAIMTSLEGAAWLTSGGTTVHGVNESFRAIGASSLGPVPIAVIISIVVIIIGYLVLERTTIGRRWYSIGGNREAAYLSGIRVKYLRFWAFVVAGAGAGLGGVLLIGRIASAHPSAGAPYTLTSLAAGFLGMTAFRNGQANVAGTFLGVLIIGVLSNGLDITNVNTYVKSIVTGGVIIAAVVAAGLARGRRIS